jgi:hypothetical protein
MYYSFINISAENIYLRIISLVILFLIILLIVSCEELDEEPPTVTILSLNENQTVYETVVISVNATDNEAVEKVELWLDGKYTGISDATEPYELKWNTIEYKNKKYDVSVRGYDVNMNTSETSPINIVVDNEAPMVKIISLKENDIIDGTVVISVNATDNEAVEKLELWLDGEFSGISDATEPYGLEWNTVGYDNRTYSVSVRGYDNGMNMSETTPINIVVDNEPPTVTILSLDKSDAVYETVVISVNATDNEAIEKVELWLDGEFSGISDATDPYELKWNTIGYESKTYSVTVRGYDIGMNMSETEPISIAVDNSEEFTIPSSITNTVHVKTEPELRAAVQIENTYIILENDITLTTSSNYKLARGVIINGYGSNYGTHGKIVYANGTMPTGAFFEMGEESEIWGIRLFGDYSSDSKGIIAYNKTNIKIKNCELTGFTNYAIKFGGNTSSTYKKGYITSNYIHDNQQLPYGYGIVINKNSEVYVSKNKFINNRHHIASRDHKDSNGNDYLGVRYEASYNIILENTENEEAHFDAHGNESYGSCLMFDFLWDHGQAGSWIKIHDNIFLGNRDIHVLLRGIPVSTVTEGGGYRIYNNNFGPNMGSVSACNNLGSSNQKVAVLFTDRNIVADDNFTKYVTIYDNY